MHNLKGTFAAVLLFISLQVFSQAYPGSLTVRVFDARTKKPVRHLYTSLSSEKESKGSYRITDDNGVCKYRELYPTTYNLYCSGFGGYKSVYVTKIPVYYDSIYFDVYLKKKHDFFFNQLITRVNFHQGWRGMGEITVGLANFDDDHTKLFGDLNYLQSIEAGCQFNFNRNHFIIGPSLTYNNTTTILHFGGSFIYYTDFDKRTLFLNPHLGFSWNTYVDFYFGYNIPLMRNQMKGMVNRFTFTVSVPLFNRNYFSLSLGKSYHYDVKKKKPVRG